MEKSSRVIRFGYAVAAVLSIMALALHIQNWFRGATFNSTVASSMSGLIILMVTGAINLGN
jgi:hypothetical protein